MFARRLAAAAAVLLAVPALAVAPAKRTPAELSARCEQRPYPGPRWCAAQWRSRPSWSPSSSWYIPEAWLRAKLARIASCESGQRWHIATGNGFYGGLQFALGTWRAMGGEGYPHEASASEQLWRGARLYRMAGGAPWPVCSRR
jgi:hypothetical protein